MIPSPGRHNRLTRLPALLLLLLATALPLQAPAQERDPYKHLFGMTFGDFQEELAMAREEDKKAVMIFFEMDGCPYCRYMKEEVLNRPEVQDYYNTHFASFAVDVEGALEITDFQGRTTTEREWAAAHGVHVTPVFLFFDLEGEPIARHTGTTDGPGPFLKLGRYVAEGHYRDQSLEAFLKEVE
ncbi:Thioredoxin-related protein [Ectothiorhodospira mobilis]|uniref:Thioredoxin-related protein n=1 Tax=Ectothiorhodospira mobilis TaxID=195064 RepID=A0A1I4PBC7_ECTMO|nr:thioredoxin family protein [Ectothiorhodospira mobilis]SFM24866.1 Thioredoxin-related protein [Ectothiorhodospira mobilis]